MKGKHAARSDNRRQHQLEVDNESLRSEVNALKEQLHNAEQRVRYVKSLETELALIRTAQEGDKLFAETWEEILRLRKVCQEWEGEYRAVLNESGEVTRMLGKLLGWDRPTMHEFVIKNAPSMLPDGQPEVSRIGIQNDHLDDEATKRIQIARGIRKLPVLTAEPASHSNCM